MAGTTGAFASVVFVCAIAVGPTLSESTSERYEYTHPAMGTQALIVLYARDADEARAAADAAFARIDALDRTLSDYREDSELMRLSRRSGGGPVAVSDDLFRVLRASRQMFDRTGGAFDATVGPLSLLWRRARRLGEMPDAGSVAVARALVGGDRLTIDEAHRTVTLATAGMRLDLGGIAKGFAADEATRVLAHAGVVSSLVALGGDIRVTAPPPEAAAWQIAVAGVEAGLKAGPTDSLALRHAAVSTSGDAEQFIEIGGVRYSHVLDPRRGEPITGRRSATVVASDATSSDALAKAVVVLGSAAAMRVVDGIPGAAARLTVSTAAGTEIYESSRWRASHAHHTP